MKKSRLMRIYKLQSRDLRFVFFIIVVLISVAAIKLNSSVFATTPRVKADDKPMIVDVPFADEQLIYSAEFSRALLRGIDIAEVRFTAHKQATPTDADKTSETNDDNYNFTAEVTSKGWFQKLFNLTFRLSMKSFVEAKNFVVARTLKLDEQGKRRRESEAVFNRTENLVTWTERNPAEPDKEPRTVRSPLQGATQDLVSVFYYLRTQKLESSTNFTLALSDSGKVYQIPITVNKRTKLRTILGETSAVEITADMFGDNRPFEGKGSMTLWFSDDAKRIPLRARITSEPGTLDIKLKQITTLRANS